MDLSNFYVCSHNNGTSVFYSYTLGLRVAGQGSRVTAKGSRLIHSEGVPQDGQDVCTVEPLNKGQVVIPKCPLPIVIVLVVPLRREQLSNYTVRPLNSRYLVVQCDTLFHKQSHYRRMYMSMEPHYQYEFSC